MVVEPLKAQLQSLGRFIIRFWVFSANFSLAGLALDRVDVLFYTPEPTSFLRQLPGSIHAHLTDCHNSGRT